MNSLYHVIRHAMAWRIGITAARHVPVAMAWRIGITAARHGTSSVLRHVPVAMAWRIGITAARHGTSSVLRHVPVAMAWRIGITAARHVPVAMAWLIGITAARHGTSSVLRHVPVAMAWLIGFTATLPGAMAQAPVKQGGWLVENVGGQVTMTMEMTLHPRGEPRPALKHRLILDDFEQVDGNAAIYYLKALGFLEQNSARNWINDYIKQSVETARSEGKDTNSVRPHVWQSMSPRELPLEEVKEYLSVTSFQPPYLREASRRRTMHFDRQIQEVEDPIGYLLPEIQTMRELARLQSLRCKVAIAEGRIDDAIAILGEQYSMAWHLGQDEFLVSNLVGLACAGIAWENALYLVQHPDAPNLYWAFASLPRPLVDVRRAFAFERQFLYQQLPVLREVNETPRPASYWRDFIDRLIPQIGSLASELHLPAKSDDPNESRAAIVAWIAAAHPGAVRYLTGECGLPRDQVEAYPTAQAVFLAVVRYYERTRDAYFKWSFLPIWQQPSQSWLNEALLAQSEQIGWGSLPTDLLLPGILATRAAASRVQQEIGLVQTVEAIRMFGAAHDGKLPATLDELPFPAPMDPLTGKPLDYEFRGDHAILSGHRSPGLQYRLVLRFAPNDPR